MTISSIQVLAWRDLDDPTAGGSEVHLNRLLAEWADRGLDVTLRTARVRGEPAEIERNGVRVVRRGGPITSWLRTIVAAIAGRDGRFDARFEVWHGISFFAPLWSRLPTIGLFHHVHADQFSQVLPPGLSHLARWLEARLYPRLYRGERLVVLSDSVRRQMIDELGWPPDDLVVVEPGVEERFVPGPRADTPTVVVVARFMPQKRVGDAVRVLAAAKRSVPDLRAVIVGDGPDRPAVVDAIAAEGAGDWIHLTGRLDDDELVKTYQQAWLVLSCSRKEGWGMTVTEGGACATPAVVTDISGHREAVVDGVTGLLADDLEALTAAVVDLLTDHDRRTQMGEAARRHASGYRWPAAADRILAELEAVAGS